MTQEILGLKKCIILSPENRGTVCHAGPQGMTPGWSGGKRDKNEGESLGHLYWSFKGKARQGKINNLGLPHLNNCEEL